jgi:Ca2+-binding RTX toxin-like protein
VYLDSEVDTIRTVGTAGNDNYKMIRLDGVVNKLDLMLGAGDDTFEGIGDFDNNGATGAGMITVTIDGEAGDDFISLDSSMLDTGTYRLKGGAGKDRIKISGIYAAYAGVVIEGGIGDDKLSGGDGPDTIFGGHDDSITANTVVDGFDIITGGKGNDIIDGGDEFSSQVYSGDTTKLTLKDIAVFSPDTGSVWTPGAVLRTSEIYKADGTPFAFYDKMGRPITSAPNASGLGTLVTLTNSNFSARSFFGDVIDGGEGDDTIKGGDGF